MASGPDDVDYPHPIIAREGWPYLAASVAVAALVTWFAGWLWSAPLWIVVVFVLQFFRDPPRTAPGDVRTVVAPADGRIVAVGAAYDPYLKRDTLKVSIFMNVFNAHSNRSPVDGEVRQRWYHPGTFVNASLDKACLENERNALWIHAKAGGDVICVQVAGLIARRILCYVDQGVALHRGQRFGFIRFGSRVDVYLPKDATVKAAIGDKVHAATSVIALLQDHG